jgi:hypothetical protein
MQDGPSADSREEEPPIAPAASVWGTLQRRARQRRASAVCAAGHVPRETPAAPPRATVVRPARGNQHACHAPATTPTICLTATGNGEGRQRERQARRGSLRAVASTAGDCGAREVEYCQRSRCRTGGPRIPARRSPRQRRQRACGRSAAPCATAPSECTPRVEPVMFHVKHRPHRGAHNGDPAGEWHQHACHGEQPR